MVLRLYAVVGADHPLPDHPGVRGAELTSVRSGDLAAVASSEEAGDEADDASDQDAVDHLELITALVADGPVIPLRFGTIAPDEGAVRDEVLESSRDAFEQHLAATAGVVEVLVVVQFDEDAALREVVTPDDLGGTDGADMSERVAIGEHVVERLVGAARGWADRLLGRALERAEAVAALETPEPTSVRYALLVRRDRLADLDTEMRQVSMSDTVPCHVEYVGPLPPVDFPLETTADDSNSSRWGW
jgi:hypothetical protein